MRKICHCFFPMSSTPPAAEPEAAQSEIQQPTWAELLGGNNWQGLLEPLNLNLRRLIFRCGDFCQATYDAFNNDPNSRYAGSSRYGKKSFFDKVMLESASDYQVYCFLYATARVGIPEAILLHSRSRESWDRESNWIGYIATTTDEASRALGRREIYVAWRGTSRDYEWIDVFSARPESAEKLLSPKSWNKKNRAIEDDDDDDDDKAPKVMYGWLTVYVSEDPNSSFTKKSARNQLMKKMNALIEQYKNEKLSIVFTGHSLGATLSILSAFDLVENGVTEIPVTAIVFGSPQVGNKEFGNRVSEFPNLKILHVKNKIDLIPLYPSGLFGYVNTGTVLEIDSRKSPYLKDSRNPSDWHNLQSMLHVVDGWNGEDGKFELTVKRSLALVNKSCGFLKEEYLVPESWWVEKNKGMVIDENGDWILAPPAEEDLPVPED
ncbi:OLC1v1023717C1 [Oldenlandia corymbosa var. corymbosa]|uniref:Phospholipase A1 n=1 Tax=Oldenlandia corymbosa var. corymbosa TaxID=529605 RepID=A0AAV1C1J6_OLDCO|nr:OLC1v1023717C1 [Oldenlandia corymbosa var. corymbosa]